jgi:peptidoglycan/xylan/chitin deacetylase (PgdA/CDA1 family)
VTAVPFSERSRLPRSGLVLLYHRVGESGSDPLGLCVSPTQFADQLTALAEELDVVPMSEVASRVREGSDLGGLAAITFDDGYIDNLDVAAPIIAGAGMPVTLFAATGHIARSRRFFWDESWRLICGPGPRPDRLDVHVDGVTGSWSTRTDHERIDAYRWLHGLIQPRSDDVIEAVLARLGDWAGVGAPAPPESTRPMTVDELRMFARVTGGAIGAHTRTHVNLGHQDDATVRAEIAGSRKDVTDWLGVEPEGFSFPFGLPRHDVSPVARAEVEAAGFAYAVVNQPVPVEPGDDVYALPRRCAPKLGGAEFRAWLQRVLR